MFNFMPVLLAFLLYTENVKTKGKKGSREEGKKQLGDLWKRTSRQNVGSREPR